MMLLTNVQERYELALYLLKFGGIFLIGILQVLECTARINIVAGIDAHLLAVEGSNVGRVRREMYVSHKGSLIAVGFQTGRDILHILRLASTLCSESHQFTSCVDDTLRLRHAPLRVIGVDSSHRLDTDGIGASDADMAHTGLRTNSSCTHTSPPLDRCWLSQS